MPEIVLTPGEQLTDRLLAQQADSLSEQIATMRRSHQADCVLFLATVAARAGCEIPGRAKRVARPDGSVVLAWEDEPQTPPATEPQA